MKRAGIHQIAKLAKVSIGTVNRATDLSPEMAPFLKRGTIRASIYRDPYLQGQTAVRLLTDLFLNGTEIPKTCFSNPGIVLRSNLELFRETRPKGALEWGSLLPP